MTDPKDDPKPAPPTFTPPDQMKFWITALLTTATSGAVAGMSFAGIIYRHFDKERSASYIAYTILFLVAMQMGALTKQQVNLRRERLRLQEERAEMLAAFRASLVANHPKDPHYVNAVMLVLEKELPRP